MNDICLTGAHAAEVLMTNLINEADSAFSSKLSADSAGNYMSYMDGQAKIPLLEGLPNAAPCISRSETVGLCETLGLAAPIEVVVPDARLRRNSAKLKCSVHPKSLPQTQYLEVSPGISCASPALIAAERCACGSDVELVTLMSLFMGIFSKHLETGRFVPRRAIAGVSDFEAFAARCCTEKKRYEGIERMAALIPYALPGAASPKEIETGLMASLPVDWGGCGLTEAQINGSVKIPNSNRKRYCDLLWPKQAVGVEYDSDQEHVGVDALHEDALHRNDLAAAGVSLFFVTSEQLTKLSLFNRTMSQVSKALGMPQFPKTRLFHERQRLLQGEIRAALSWCGF